MSNITVDTQKMINLQVSQMEAVVNRSIRQLLNQGISIHFIKNLVDLEASHYIRETENVPDIYLASNPKPLENPTPQASQFEGITEEMLQTFIRKNADYGGAFDVSLDDDGLLVAKIRLGDKYKRFSTLISGDGRMKVNDESLEDTLLDMANYAIMTVMWMRNQNKIPEGPVEV